MQTELQAMLKVLSQALAEASEPDRLPLLAHLEQAAKERQDFQHCERSGSIAASISRRRSSSPTEGRLRGHKKPRHDLRRGALLARFLIAVPATPSRNPMLAWGRVVFHPGPTGGEDLRSYFAAGGSQEAATEAAAASLRNAALRRDGTFDGSAIHQWMKQHDAAINELPPEVRDRFQHSIDAQDAHDEIVAKPESARERLQAQRRRPLHQPARPVWDHAPRGLDLRPKERCRRHGLPCLSDGAGPRSA